MNLNKVFLAGHLVAKPQLRKVASGDEAVDFRIGTNRRWRDPSTNEPREAACFIDVKAYGKRARLIYDTFTGGKAIFIEGHLRLDTWEKPDGTKRSKHVVIVDSFSFVGPRPLQQQPAPASAPQVEAAPDDLEEPEEDMGSSDDGVAPRESVGAMTLKDRVTTSSSVNRPVPVGAGTGNGSGTAPF